MQTHEHSMKITVRSTHLDRFGHVNNARFLEFFEWARWEWATQVGWDFEELMTSGLNPAVVHIEIDYRSQLFFRDEVEVRTRVLEIRQKSIVLGQVMLRDGHTVSEARVVVVLVDAARQQAVVIPERLRKLLEP